MPRFANDIEVIQAALHRVGEASISSLTDGSASALVAAANYEGIVGDFLERHAWTWATKTATLTVIGESDNNAWGYEYALPDDLINLRFLTLEGIQIGEGQWTLQGEKILVQAEGDYQATYTYRAPVSAWSFNFGEAVVTRLQAVFLEGLLDRWQDARLKEKDADAKFLKAMVRDKRQAPGTRAYRASLAQRWTNWRGPDYRRATGG